MNRWADTLHCTGGEHCRPCRDLEGGRPWRRKIAAAFAVPGGEVDWECPYGRPWGAAGQGPIPAPSPAPSPAAPPPLVAARLVICRACLLWQTDRRGSKCGLYGGPPCRWAAYVGRGGAVCLGVPPQWAPA